MAKREVERSDTASEAPNFTLSDAHGSVWRLGDYKGRRHLVLVFTRGFR